MRPGAPERRAYTRGRLPDLSAPASRAAALADFHGDVYAGTSRESNAFKLRTILRVFADWGTEPYPPSVDKVALLGATLKAGGYRSAAGYLSLYRTTCAREGHGFGPELAVAARDAARACARGLGAPIRASPLTMGKLHELGGGRSPWIPGGPCSPRNALTTGCWWLLREIELATLRASLVDVGTNAAGQPTVSITLAASKSDPAALGVARSHRCRCAEVASQVGCPAHVVLDQLAFLRRQWPAAWVDGRPRRDLPLFPGLAGKACSKPAVVGTIVAAAVSLGIPLADADGSTRISGHSLRVSGAQGLARAGFPLWSIQLMGRWGSEAVKQYVGDTALDVFVESRPATAHPDLTDLGELMESLGRTGATADRRSVRPTDRASDRPPLRIDTDIVEQLLSDLVAPWKLEVEAALQQELRLLLARAEASPPKRPTLTDSATETDQMWVQNSRTRVWHRSGVGPSSGQPSRHWSAICGWAYGISRSYAVAPPPQGAERCDRCVDIASKRGLG